MTKKDIKSVAVSSSFALGGFLLFWFVIRPRLAAPLREYLPVELKWVDPSS